MTDTKQYLTYKPGAKMSGFSVISAQYHKEIAYPTGEYDDEKNPLKAGVYEMLHNKSGAKLIYVENEDPDMSFSISFKTPPKDSTGVFHIIEHSVLCGSKKFPVKEPFTYLLKSSMQTFLNAITFPDKTMYPVASTNMKDLLNLTDVYMDAVLFPNLYHDENIFRQEGHHQVVDNDSNLSHSGVVLNEMKGFYGDSGNVVFEELTASLFPDTCYKYDSGGKPGIIEKLTYEQFLNEYDKHYRLDNSYIILYGNMDAEKMLSFLDKNYLSCPEKIKQWRKNNVFSKSEPRMIDYQNPIEAKFKTVEMNTAKENAIAGCAYAYSKDRLERLAVSILISAIASSNESPLKSILLKKSLGKDIIFSTTAELNIPILLVELKQPNKEAAKNLRSFICESVKELLKQGIDKREIKASIEKAKFCMKEKLPNWSSGVDVAIAIMSDWLYRDNCIEDIFNTSELIDKLEKLAETDYFENLALKLFCDNNHTACVEVVPTSKSQECKPTKVNIEQSLQIKELMNELDLAQSTPDSIDDIRKLPNLKLSDIQSKKPLPELKCTTISNTEVLNLDIKSIGISYFQLAFSITQITYEDLPYLSILSLLLGKLDTKGHKAAELQTIIRGKFGDFAVSPKIYKKYNSFDNFDLMFLMTSSCLDKHCALVAKMSNEILTETLFSDYDKIKTILEQSISEFEQLIISSGHIMSSSRAASYYSKQALVQQQLEGMDFYFFQKNLIKNFDRIKEKLNKKLSDLSQKLFNEKPTISILSSDTCAKNFISNLPKYTPAIEGATLNIPKPKDLHEGFVIPGSVNYAGLAYNTKIDNNINLPANIISSMICSLNYLWEEVRVKGGAYGAGMSVASEGVIRCYSYRDPNLESTINHFKHCMDWLLEQNITKEQLSDYIISAVSKMDAPQTIREIFKQANLSYFTGKNQKVLMEIRQNLIEAKPEDIINSATIVSKSLQKGKTCVFGTKESIKNSDYNAIEIFS